MQRFRRAVIALGFAILLPGASASAQYFGRNKVQYQRFDFQVLQTQHFDVFYYAEEKDAAAVAARMAERWYARFSRILGHQLSGRQALIVYASHPHFEQTNAVPGFLGEGTGGVTESFKRRIVLPFGASLAETDHVIGHELVHAFQYDILTPGRAGYMPLWFMEGMAEYLSVGPVDPHTATWIRDAMIHDDLPTLRQLESPRYFPYRFGQALWAYIGGRWGDEAVGRMLREAGRTRDAMLAVTTIASLPPDSLSAQWHAAIRATYQPLLTDTRPVDAQGTGVVTRATGGGRLNVAPALSPDGSRLAFLSERKLFSIDMFVADATSGRVIRQLTRTAVDPHYESLQFIGSAGSWDPEGHRLVFAAVAKGRPLLVIADAESGSVVDEIPFRQLDEILTPAWSPDGRRVAFTAMTGGQADLFIYTLEGGGLRRITNDVFADLQPAWSPDGRSLAFVTDRYSTRLGDLDPREYRLARYDLADGDVSPLPGFAAGGGAKHVSPQWAPDGRSIYFVSDPDGVSNVHRLDLATGGLFQVTDLPTGAMGITSLSPALSMALRAPRLAVNVYDDGRHEIRVLSNPATLTGRPVASTVTLRAGALPPRERRDDGLVSALRDAETGLPRAGDLRTRPYKASLSLDYVSGLNLAIAADRFGTFIGGGATLVWSSMLGEHQMVTGAQVNGSFIDTGVLLGYSNLTRRLNWGIVAARSPYVTGGFERTPENVNGEPSVVDRIYRFRQINYQLGTIWSYPMSRTQRVDLSVGVRRIDFQADVQEFGVSIATGQVTLDQKRDLSSPDGLNFAEGSLALVYDNSYFGGTGPILGSRYRLEAAPTFGDLSWVNALLDYRRYEMPVRPFTLAARVFHYGRYGRDAEDSRLPLVFVGYQSLVRGYDVGSFSLDECQSGGATPCPVFDQLLGSRMLVGGAELRIPVVGPLGLGGGMSGAPPVDLAAFYDVGVAWTSGDEASFLGGPRRPVQSAGFALRINLFGFAIGEVDWVKPFDRPNKGWYFQFGLTGGAF